MKKLLCVVPVLLLFAMIGAPNADADSYTPTFTSTCPVAGGCGDIPTAPAVTFPSPTNIDLTFTQGSTFQFDIALPSPDQPTDSYTWSYSGFASTETSSGSDVITVSDLTDSKTETDTTDEIVLPGENGGSLTFSPVSAAAPETAPILLMLLGAGLIFFMRKRFVMRVPRTA